MKYDFNFEGVWSNRFFVLEGILMTLRITAIALAIGLIIGLIAGLCKMSKRKAVSTPAVFYGALLTSNINSFYCACIHHRHLSLARIDQVLSGSLSSSCRRSERMKSPVRWRVRSR